jgi:hypothetical protein
MMLGASVASGAGSYESVHAGIDTLRFSEPGGLVVLGVAFVMLANQIRRKNN